jgi:hypothetical protein
MSPLLVLPLVVPSMVVLLACILRNNILRTSLLYQVPKTNQPSEVSSFFLQQNVASGS